METFNSERNVATNLQRTKKNLKILHFITTCTAVKQNKLFYCLFYFISSHIRERGDGTHVCFF